MRKQYDNIEIMFHDAYEHVKLTNTKVKLSKLKSEEDGDATAFLIELSNGDEWVYYPYRHAIPATFGSIMRLMSDQGINFEQLINKQLLPFL